MAPTEEYPLSIGLRGDFILDKIVMVPIPVVERPGGEPVNFTEMPAYCLTRISDGSRRLWGPVAPCWGPDGAVVGDIVRISKRYPDVPDLTIEIAAVLAQ